MGLLSGKQTEPVDRTATAGFVTLSVAPNGYTKVRALKGRKETSGFLMNKKVFKDNLSVS